MTPTIATKENAQERAYILGIPLNEIISHDKLMERLYGLPKNEELTREQGYMQRCKEAEELPY